MPRIYGVGAWTNHLHFAYDLIAALRPRIFVELGTDRGESFFAFCQAVEENEIGTRCFAVDTWKGDLHAGRYDDTTFTQVSEHRRAHYASFARLLRGSFETVRAQFFNETVDLLHLDGLHSEEAVRRDLEDWLPKLRPGGILLMHDVRVRAREFGVWKVWEEMQERGRHWTQALGPGLAVWQKPPNESLPPLVETLCAGTAEERAPLEQYYARQADALQNRIAQEWRDGAVRQLPFHQQTVIQLFHSTDGTHREENSVHARTGHDEWKEISIELPPEAGAAPLRIDFVSPWTIIEIAALRFLVAEETFYLAETLEAFSPIEVKGDAERLPHPELLRLQVTGVDPQIYLPPIGPLPAGRARSLQLRLRVLSPNE